MTIATSKVSIIIVTHNSCLPVRSCLNKLKDAVSRLNHELIVIDNDSVDGTIEEVKEIWPDASVIVSQSNRGFAAAVNVAASKAIGEFLLFLNPDVDLDPDAIGKLVATFEERPDAGAVAARMRFPNGSFQPTCRNFPTLSNMLFSRGSVMSRITGKGSNYTLDDFGETTAVPAVAGTVMMVRRNLFGRLGSFDNRFFMYMEDTDFCLRLAQAGLSCYFVPEAGGVHRWGSGSSSGRLIRLWYHHLSFWMYFMKHKPNFFSLAVLPALLSCNLIIRVAAVIITRQSRGAT